MAKWFVTAKKADFNEIAQKHEISPILARIIRNRDVTGELDIDRYLHGTTQDMHDPFLMKGMSEGTAIITEKIKAHKKIRVLGDYDIDGVCSAYILYAGLKAMNAEIDVAIPHRIHDGYGINESLIKEAYDAGVDTILTCDNGIAAKEQIAYGKSLGMTIVVTDHHEVPFSLREDGQKEYILPDVDAIINPKQEECPYPYKEICGGMVTYKFIQAMQKEMEIPSALADDLLAFAAFATVGDIMELQDENRIVVKYGLQHMASIHNPGMKALIEVNGLKDKKLTPVHLGFVLGPCLNATGRLDTAVRAIELLCADTYPKALELAMELKELNASRKQMTLDGAEAAVELVESTAVKNDSVLVIYLPECHESLAGIIAGRIKDKYHKPVFVLTKGEEGIKGSGRSIEAFHMYEHMTQIKHLFTKYGGHKMAAGLSMPENNMKEFRHGINQNCGLTEDDFVEKVKIDIALPISYATLELAEELNRLEPFGTGNAKPLFAHKDLQLLNGQFLGKDKNFARFTVMDGNGYRAEAVYFGDAPRLVEEITAVYGRQQTDALFGGRENGVRLTIAYYPEVNEYRGNRKVQLQIKHYDIIAPKVV